MVYSEDAELVSKQIGVDAPSYPRWEALVQRAVLVGRCTKTVASLRNADAQATIDERISHDAWYPLSRPLEVADVVCIEKMVRSGDEMSTTLAPGLVGLVVSIDEDGDAQVRFPDLQRMRCQLVWVLKRDYASLSCCAQAVAPPPHVIQLIKPASDAAEEETPMPTA